MIHFNIDVQSKYLYLCVACWCNRNLILMTLCFLCKNNLFGHRVVDASAVCWRLLCVVSASADVQTSIMVLQSSVAMGVTVRCVAFNLFVQDSVLHWREHCCCCILT